MKNRFLHSLAYLCFFLTGCPSQRTDREFLKREAEYSKLRIEQVARLELTTIKSEEYHLRGDERIIYVWNGENKKSFDKYAERFYKFCNGYPLPDKEELKALVEKEGLRIVITDKDIGKIKQAGFLNKMRNKAIMSIESWQNFLDMHHTIEERLKLIEGKK